MLSWVEPVEIPRRNEKAIAEIFDVSFCRDFLIFSSANHYISIVYDI